MLIDRLQTAIEHLSQLTPEQQEQLAEQIEDILDEALWNTQFSDPRSEAFFDDLVADAQRGPLRPLPTPADLGDAESENSGDRAE
jgi:hypothetical protein